MDRRDFLAVAATTPFFTLKDLETKKMRFPFLLVDKPNKNGNVYPKRVVEKALKHVDNSMIGHLGMVQDSMIHFAHASHTVSNISFEKIEGKEWLCGDIKILTTPCGKILQQLFDDGAAIAFRTCGIGNFEEVYAEPNPCQTSDPVKYRVMKDDYKLCSINAIPEEDAA
jgi:hypothetical protein